MFAKIIIKPIILMRFYNKQGIPTLIFYPFFGYTKIYMDDFHKKGDALATFKALRKEEKFKEIVVTNLGSDVFLWVISPALLKECLLNKVDCFEKIALKRLFKLFGEKQIVQNEDFEWKKSRKMLTKSFSFDILRKNTPLITAVIEEKLKKIGNAANVDIKATFQQLFSQTLMRIFFDKDFSETILDEKPLCFWVVHLTEEIFAEFLEIYIYIFGERFYDWGLRKKDRELNHYINVVRKLFSKHIKEKKEQNYFEENNLLSYLIQHEKEMDIDEDRIVNEMLTLFFAGTDTTTGLLVNILYLLSRNCGSLEKLHQEIDENIKDENKITYDEINKLEFLNAVIKETMRICGPGIFSIQRYTSKAMKLGKYFIKKNTGIMFSFVSNFYDEEIFSNAYEFKPERWVGESGNKLSQIDPYIFIPFSAGSRNCIGQHLAILEAKITLLKFLKKYRFELKNKEVKYDVKFLYEPAEPLLFDIKIR